MKIVFRRVLDPKSDTLRRDSYLERASPSPSEKRLPEHSFGRSLGIGWRYVEKPSALFSSLVRGCSFLSGGTLLLRLRLNLGIAFSPLLRADELKAPVLLIQGEKDKRTPLIHADKLAARLKELNHEFEYYVTPNEGHTLGFKPENRIANYERIRGWFDRYL